MSNAYGVTSIPAANYSPVDGIDAGVTTMSAESLLAYCQMQLGDMDTQINTQMSAQKTALREREAVQNAQTALERFGTAGPRSVNDMGSCVTAIDHAIAQLPQGDPVAAQLADFRQHMCDQYQYQPPRALTEKEQIDLITGTGPGVVASPLTSSLPPNSQIEKLRQAQSGTLRKPDSDNKEWQGTTDALANIANDIKSSADIQMLQLQDLVSQRQQVVQLCSGMMSKTDQTLEDQAKAIGR
jgi:hypothetical protein